MTKSLPFFSQGLEDELAEFLAKRGVGLVRFPAIKPFIAMGAAGILAMKLESLVPNRLINKYAEYLIFNDKCTNKCTCLDWCDNLPIGCAS